MVYIISMRTIDKEIEMKLMMVNDNGEVVDTIDMDGWDLDKSVARMMLIDQIVEVWHDMMDEITKDKVE